MESYINVLLFLNPVGVEREYIKTEAIYIQQIIKTIQAWEALL